MHQDPVCDVQIEPEYAACRAMYRGRVYFFCCPSCEDEFRQDPERWLRNGHRGSAQSAESSRNR